MEIEVGFNVIDFARQNLAPLGVVCLPGVYGAMPVRYLKLQ